MPRKLLIRSKEFPYHVTARTNNKELFPIPISNVWEIFVNEMLLLKVLYSIEIQAFVLMPNHFHLVVTTPQEDLGKVMNLFMSDITRHIHAQSGRSGRVFGARYFWSIITSTRYYGHVFKYVYRNPVKGGLCEKAEEYEFSTLGGLTGHRSSRLPIDYTRPGIEINLPEHENTKEFLEWLNTPFPKEAEELIRKFLYRREIKTLLDRNTRKPHPLLEMRL